MARSAGTGKPRMQGKRGLWSHLYVQLIGAAAILLLLQFLLAQHPLVEPLVKQLDDLQKKRLDTVTRPNTAAADATAIETPAHLTEP
jgi:hypothetical protein